MANLPRAATILTTLRPALMSTVLGLILLATLPLVGLTLAGIPLQPYLQFPPIPRAVLQPSFSPALFTALSLLLLACCIPFMVAMLRQRQSARGRRAAFPGWGWLGLIWTAAAWWIAWNRFPIVAPWQAHTFTPLWLGYIVVINAWVQQRRGQNLLTGEPRRFVLLLITSAVFWWFFEYLNRFVQNWHYVGVDQFSRLEYFCFATLPFATVLPAVVSTADLLATFPFLSGGLHSFLPLRRINPRRLAPVLFLFSSVALALVGVWPECLFPMLWVAPLAILTSLDAMTGTCTIFSPLAHGDWRRVVHYALAALVCGFFWEMWNYHSLAQWKYTIPFVQKFHVFEMPLLGYAGYLPFGLECAVIADRVFLFTQRVERPSVGAAVMRCPTS